MSSSLTAPRLLPLAALAALVAALALWPGRSAADGRDPGNPLGVAQPYGAGAGEINPLAGARFFVDREWGLAARQVRFWRHRRRADARMLEKIAREPETKRFGTWTPNAARAIRALVERSQAAQAGTVLPLSVYRFPHEACHGYDAGGPAGDASYRRWIDGFARGLGRARAVIFLEQDGLGTTGCLNRAAAARRMGLFRYGIAKLTALPHTVVYVDAGAADWLSVDKAAHLLRMAGVAGAQGFFLNSTHYDGTSREVAYGQAVSRRIGGKHFIVSTAANGRGALIPYSRVRYGNEVLCNPPGRALGPRPTTHTGISRVDAFMWIGNPGRSGGHCNGGPGVGAWWPQFALGLARRAAYR